MCLLGVSTLRNYIWGVIPKKLPHFLARIGIPSLNVQSNNFRTARPILVIRSSNDASPQKEFDYMGQTAKICFLESYYQQTPPKGVSQPKYSIPSPFNETIDSYKQQLDRCSSTSGTSDKVETRQKIQSKGAILMKIPQREFPSQNQNVLKILNG
jgi:hypothetical protein